MSSGADDARTGEIVIHYELGERVCADGMLETYKAQDRVYGHPVLITLPRAEAVLQPGIVDRVVATTGALADVKHVNMAELRVERDEVGVPLLIEADVPGQSLARYIPKYFGGMPYANVVAIMTPIVEALAHCHARNVPHGDLRADSVVLTQVGGESVAKLTGFNLVQSAIASTAGAAHLSPERRSGGPPELDADVWAAGALLYEMLAGRTHVEVGLKLVRAKPDVPEALTELVDRCLSQQAEVRPSAAQLHDVLARILARLSGVVHPEEPESFGASTPDPFDQDPDDTLVETPAPVLGDDAGAEGESIPPALMFGEADGDPSPAPDTVPPPPGFERDDASPEEVRPDSVRPTLEQSIDELLPTMGEPPRSMPPAPVGPVDNSMPPALGSPVDNSMPPALGGPVDNSMPPALGSPVDNSMPPALGGPVDNSMPPALGSPVDNSMPPALGEPVDSMPPALRGPSAAPAPGSSIPPALASFGEISVSDPPVARPSSPADPTGPPTTRAAKAVFARAFSEEGSDLGTAATLVGGPPPKPGQRPAPPAPRPAPPSPSPPAAAGAPPPPPPPRPSGVAATRVQAPPPPSAATRVQGEMSLPPVDLLPLGGPSPLGEPGAPVERADELEKNLALHELSGTGWAGIGGPSDLEGELPAPTLPEPEPEPEPPRQTLEELREERKPAKKPPRPPRGWLIQDAAALMPWLAAFAYCAPMLFARDVSPLTALIGFDGRLPLLLVTGAGFLLLKRLREIQEIEQSFALTAAIPLLAVALVSGLGVNVLMFFDGDLFVLAAKIFSVALAYSCGLFLLAFLAALIARMFDANDPNFGLASVLMLVALLTVAATYWVVSRNVRIASGTRIEAAYKVDFGGLAADYVRILNELSGEK